MIGPGSYEFAGRVGVVARTMPIDHDPVEKRDQQIIVEVGMDGVLGIVLAESEIELAIVIRSGIEFVIVTDLGIGIGRLNLGWYRD